MTDPEFEVLIDYTGMTKRQLFETLKAMAGLVETTLNVFAPSVNNGSFTREQAAILNALRDIKGTDWVEGVALSHRLDPEALQLAGDVRDWINLNRGASEVEIRAQFPNMSDDQWRAILDYLLNAKLVKPAFRT